MSNADTDSSRATNLMIQAGRVALQYGPAAPVTSELVAVLGEVERRAGRPIEALDRLVTQLDRITGTPGDIPALRARMAAGAARIFYDEGDLPSALAYARDAVAAEIASRSATGLSGPDQLGPAADGSDAFTTLVAAAYRSALP